MWRLRAVDEAYFEQFYTKLIRHVSQGRLLRGSSRGVLLVGQDRYHAGRHGGSPGPTDQRPARTARLRTRQRAESFSRTGRRGPSRCGPIPAGRGPIAGQFPALLEGTYRLELPVPGKRKTNGWAGEIQVKAPDLERENPRRNNALLSTIARDTGGKYYVGMSSAIAARASPPWWIS